MHTRAHDIARSVAASDQYLDGIPDSEFEKIKCTIGRTAFADLVSIPVQSRAKLEEHLSQSAEYAQVSLDDVLEASWVAAFDERAVRIYDEKIHIPLLINDFTQNAPIEITLKKSDPDRSNGRPFYLQWVGYVRLEDAVRLYPGKALESFAYINWDKLLSDLAGAALDEPWDFGRPDRFGHHYEILKSYINYTFYRLEQQGKVCISDDGSLAAFDSGLVDRWYQDIFVCFEPQYGETEWRYLGLAAKGNRQLKKRVTEHFDPLPQKAKWFESLQDVLYDPEKKLEIDYEHILLDNLKRFPLDWILHAIKGVTELGIDTDAQPIDDAFYQKLVAMIEEDYAIYDELQTKIERAVKLAHRRISWNYKAAIPSYYPTRDSMSFLLPLCLRDTEVADAALVVELQPSGAYQGVTVLDMEMAYKDARLICRPDSDWLDVALI